MAAAAACACVRVSCVSLACVVVLFLVAPTTTLADLPDTQPCPEACACRYDRVFWVTDCARRGLKATPEGLSVEGYSLDLTGNAVEKLGPFPEGSRLRRLLVTENRVSRVSGDDLAALELLVEVDLSRNQLKEIDVTAFRNSAGLLTLRLAENVLEAPPGALLSSSSLKNLDLRANRLRTLPGGAFANCTALSTLDLSDNPLGALPTAAFSPLRSLETLNVARCGLEALDPAALAPLAQLKSLDASGNRLGAAGRWAPALKPLARLDSLALESSALEGPLPEDALERCSSLRHLALGHNPLLREPWRALAPLPSLAELLVQDCGVRSLPAAEERANLTALRLLDASDNPLGPALAPGALALPALETLVLARCGLKEAPAHAVFQEEEGDGDDGGVSVPPLEQLSLAGNEGLVLRPDAPLLPAPAQGLLRTLDLSYCSLRQLPGASMRGANNLTELHLRANLLDEVPEDALRELPALTTLDLRDCRLRAARHEQLAHSPRLRALRLGGNPWACSCALRDLWAWAEEGKGDLGVLEAAHNLSCVTSAAAAAAGTEDGGGGGEMRAWAALDDCAREAAGDGDRDRERRSVAQLRQRRHQHHHQRASLLAPVAGGATLVVGAAATVGALALLLWRRRRHLRRAPADAAKRWRLLAP